jgi:hypothetical protein
LSLRPISSTASLLLLLPVQIAAVEGLRGSCCGKRQKIELTDLITLRTDIHNCTADVIEAVKSLTNQTKNLEKEKKMV